MPLSVEQVTERYVLRCANAHLPGRETMTRSDVDMSFVAVRPPAGGRMPELDLTRGTPVALYVCDTCGYVEAYSARTVFHDKWSEAPGGR